MDKDREGRKHVYVHFLGLTGYPIGLEKRE